MANYTVQLRNLIDTGFNIGLTGYPIFDESHRDILNKKIIEHYYFREIGQEVPQQFVYFLNRKMNEIMPLYNQMYESELLKFDPLINVCVKTLNNKVNDQKTENTNDSTTNGNTESTNKSTNENNSNSSSDSNNTSDSSSSNVSSSSNTGNSSSSSNATNSNDNLFSETPQNGLQGVKDGNYLTNATITNGDNSTNSSDSKTENSNSQGSNSSNSKSNTNSTDKASSNSTTESSDNVTSKTLVNAILKGDSKTIENIVNEVTGYTGTSASELLNQFRSTMINIDLMIIEELNILFMGLYN